MKIIWKLFAHLDNVHREFNEMRRQELDKWIEHQRESEQLGFISDEDKIRILKRELYEQSRLYATPERTQRLEYLRDAIDCLEAIREAEFQRKYDVRKWVDDVLSLTLLGGLTVVITAYLASFGCGSNNSNFCEYSRHITTEINTFFQPKQ
ncbi:MAG: hypothetical protein SAK29_01295 [Scytonema sp. PMC 1069.18]|nr:hypothetical protein [Scytonema sp. PMC 1069.18]MEC4811910.1 hypothetical protein [Scytonema sp. PMC 1069.18]MEC4884987.1 hypothetical protein [Scytonema sp. PMC 1070.18]